MFTFWGNFPCKLQPHMIFQVYIPMTERESDSLIWSYTWPFLKKVWRRVWMWFPWRNRRARYSFCESDHMCWSAPQLCCRDVEHESTWGQTPLSLSVWISEQIRRIYMQAALVIFTSKQGCESLSVLFRLTPRSPAHGSAQTPVTSARRPSAHCARVNCWERVCCCCKACWDVLTFSSDHY